MERFAELAAEIRHRSQVHTAEILARAGLSPGEWEDVKREWMAVIEADLDGGRGHLLTFAATFTEARIRLRDEAKPAPPARLPSVNHPPAALSETADLDLRGILQTVLPFADPPMEHNPGGTGPRSTEAVSDAGIAGASPGRAPSLDETGRMDVRRLMSKVLPFQDGAAPTTPPAIPELTIEQFASLAAELSLGAEDAAHIRIKYRIPSEDAYRELSAEWQRRMAAEPAVSARYRALYLHYRAWLVENKR